MEREHAVEKEHSGSKFMMIEVSFIGVEEENYVQEQGLELESLH